MKSYMITYDLCTPGKDYESLIKSIKDYGNYAKINESCWIIKTLQKAVDIRNSLKSHIDSNDRLFVATLTGEAAWCNSVCSNKWLNNNL